MSTAYDFDTPTPTTSSRPTGGQKVTMQLSRMPRTGPELFIERLSMALGVGQDDKVAAKVFALMSDRVGEGAITPAAEWNAYLASLVGTRFPIGQIVHVRERLAALAGSAGGSFPPPQAGPGDDDSLMLVWNTADDHLEIEVFSDGRWEWFHSADGVFHGNDQLDAEAPVPDALARVLPRFIAR